MGIISFIFFYLFFGYKMLQLVALTQRHDRQIIKFRVSKNEKKLLCYICDQEKGHVYYRFLNMSLNKKFFDISDKIINLLQSDSNTIRLIINTNNQTIYDIVEHIENLTEDQREFIKLKLI